MGVAMAIGTGWCPGFAGEKEQLSASREMVPGSGTAMMAVGLPSPAVIKPGWRLRVHISGIDRAAHPWLSRLQTNEKGCQ